MPSLGSANKSRLGIALRFGFDWSLHVFSRLQRCDSILFRIDTKRFAEEPESCPRKMSDGVGSFKPID